MEVTSNCLQIYIREIYINKSINWQSQERFQAKESQELHYFYTEYIIGNEGGGYINECNSLGRIKFALLGQTLYK